ncbi:hypothetical protein NE237_015556 [Protea cynaroides]|uniref:Uncharacterized protein n=1 Tax=Protea cynaroides TaxID=273540 RepID=A0A9Q0KE99_9MAGN|nr:hypothetical protein NE237_015556 [Protea cynaroides]
MHIIVSTSTVVIWEGERVNILSFLLKNTPVEAWFQEMNKRNTSTVVIWDGERLNTLLFLLKNTSAEAWFQEMKKGNKDSSAMRVMKESRESRVERVGEIEGLGVWEALSTLSLGGAV